MHQHEINKLTDPIPLNSLMDCMPDFPAAMKNKRTIESLQNSVDGVVAHFKIESNQIAERVKVNLTTLRELAGEYKFLFSDTPQLVTKDNEDLVAVIKTRISDHKKAEEDKLEAQREKMRLEEESKAEKKIEEQQKAKDLEAASDANQEPSIKKVPALKYAIDKKQAETAEINASNRKILEEPTLIGDIQEWARHCNIDDADMNVLFAIFECYGIVNK